MTRLAVAALLGLALTLPASQRVADRPHSYLVAITPGTEQAVEVFEDCIAVGGTLVYIPGDTFAECDLP